jgi:hypothetical protein
VSKGNITMSEETWKAVVRKMGKLEEKLAKNKTSMKQMTVKRDMLLKRMSMMHSKMNCVCRLNPLVGDAVPCETCQIAELMERAL